MATMMKYKVNDIVKATVTKSKPGQDVGLSLEERDNRIYVTNVGGLFQRNGVPVHVEDQLLQVNGMSVSNKDLFPNGIEDVSRFLKAEWNVWVKVKKGSNSEDAPDQDEPIIGDTSISYPSIQNRQVKYSSPYLHSYSASYDSEDATNAYNSENEATASRRSCEPQRSRSRSSSPHWARKPRSNRKPRSMRKKKAPEDAEDYSESTETTCALSDDDQTPPTPRAEAPNLLSITEDESTKSLTPNYISNMYDVKDQDQQSDNETTQSDDVSIKSIKGNSREIHIEMNDGQSISVTPDQLLRVVNSDEKSVVTEASSATKSKKKKSKGKRSKRDLQKKSKREQRKKSSKNLNDSDFEQSEGEMPLSHSVKKSKKKVKRRNSTGYLKQDDDDCSVGTMSSRKSTRSKRSKRKVKRRNSTGYLRNPEADADSLDSMSDAGSVRSTRSSRTREPRRKGKSMSSLPNFRSSRNKRGSLMDSSTHECMTNLIDPGDLMKIRGFTSKPEMNDMTVEVVRRSKGTKGKRWDVRIITTKNVKARCSFDPKRLISVATENLKHFV